jgi:hypothetical protein
MADLIRMAPAQIQAMQMMSSTPTVATRVTWFLEGMIHHHGGALIMAHDALDKSSNPTIRRLARSIIVAQRQEIIRLRRMLQHDGLNPPIMTPAFLRLKLTAPLLIAPLMLGMSVAKRVHAQPHDMFPTKAAALQRAKQLKCAGAFAMGPHWMPCKDLDAYNKAVRRG